jgi:hypothetical protein
MNYFDISHFRYGDVNRGRNGLKVRRYGQLIQCVFYRKEEVGKRSDVISFFQLLMQVSYHSLDQTCFWMLQSMRTAIVEFGPRGLYVYYFLKITGKRLSTV